MAKSEFDKIMDTLAPDLEMEEAESTQEAPQEDAQEPGKAESEPDEPEASEPTEDDSGDAEDDADERDVEPVAAESAEEPTSEDTGREAAALRAEIAKLRAKNQRLRREREREEKAPQAGTTVPVQQQQQPSEPVSASHEDDAFELSMRDGRVVMPRDQIASEIEREINRRMPQPTPEERLAQQAMASRAAFVAGDPDKADAWDTVDTAMSWLREQTLAKAYELEADTSQWDVGRFMSFAEQAGVMGSFAKVFPDMVEDVGMLVAAGSSMNDYFVHQAIGRYAKNRKAHKPANGREPAKIQGVPKSPPSLARAGTTSENTGTDASRLEELAERERIDPINGLSAGEIKELDRLQRKFAS